MKPTPRVGCLFALLLILTGASRAQPESGWLGLYTEPVDELPEIEAQAGGEERLGGARSGLRVTAVVPDSPADEGGILAGDIVVAMRGEPFACPAESARVVLKRILDASRPGEPCALRVIRDAVTRELAIDASAAADDAQRRFWRDPEETISALTSGQQLEARAGKRQQVLDLEILLGLRPAARWPAPRANDAIYPPGSFAPNDLEALLWALADDHGVRAQTRDLLTRLAGCHTGCDPYRLECMVYVHRDPFRLESVSRRIDDELGRKATAREMIAACAPLLVPEHTPTLPPSRRLRPPETAVARDPAGAIEPLIAQIIETLGQARVWHRRAFAALTEQERAFLEEERWQLSDVFAEEVYVNFDEDPERFAKNRRLIELALKIDYGALCEAAERLALLTDAGWARGAAARVRAAFADRLEEEILLTRETPFGRILIGGTGRHWYRDTDTAFVLDLGGDDLYTGNCGGSAGWSCPLSVCIDIAGDDAYESTRPACQGTGCLGAGGLLDLAGNDTYIGIQWAQGTGYFGIGWLHDLAGDDTYRGRTFCQAVGLFGIGLLCDEDGRDRYEGDCHVQGCGCAKGIGALVDRDGDDEYYAKGLYPTGYGDAGIFDAWSQGCGMGFRWMASGGLGLLHDGGGCDRMEAGNFSQGGGYYYGYGIVRAAGDDNDIYIGSRYNQGFCAHQAVGVFLEDGGDDFYTTRHGVAQALAWDECATLFVDESGNDTYQGGQFFSQGASAHNSICIFRDRRGRDTYTYPPGQARAGGNDYHGGTSFSIFIDEGGRADTYDAEQSANDHTYHRPEHGFFLDLRGSVDEALARRVWRR